MTNTLELPAARFAGRYKLQVHRDGALRHETEWFDNLITTAGLEALGEAKTPGRYGMVGTDNTAPANGNTALGAQLASFDSNTGGVASGSVVTTGTRYGWQRQTYPFAQGAVVGNVAEVGVGWSTTAVFSRALVSPAVSILSIDQLTVVYELRMYVPTSDVTGSVTIGATSYSYTIRPIRADANANAGYDFGWKPALLNLGASTREWCVYNSGAGRYGALAYGTPCVIGDNNDTVIRQTYGGTVSNNTNPSWPASVSNAAYTGGSLECRFTTTWSTASGNETGGLQGFIFNGLFGTYQCVLSAAVPKDNTKELSIIWKQSWARH